MIDFPARIYKTEIFQKIFGYKSILVVKNFKFQTLFVK